MAFTLADAYIRTGAVQSPQEDARLTASLNVALAVVENYLDRKFMFSAQADKFYYTHNRNFLLSRYPVVSIISITGIPGGIVVGTLGASVWQFGQHRVHHLIGKIECAGFQTDDEIEVQYVGGYRILPADLELALWLVFDTVLMLGSSGSGTLGAGEITSITVPDVGTVRFATGAEGRASASGSDNAMLPDAALALLQPYRRRAVS